MFRKTIARMASLPNSHIGATGHRYQFEKLIQQRPHSGSVWLARSGHDQFILKDIPKDIFCNFNEEIHPRLHESLYIRLPWDTIPSERIFVYRYMDDDLLSLVKKEISTRARKKILKAVLLGIAELHERGVVHLDIKPDNIMVDHHSDDEEDIIRKVQIIDVENAAYLPKSRCIKGMLPGNDNWRSPEGHFKGELNKPTDIFSFGIVCIYAMLGRIILGPDDDFEKHYSQGALPVFIRLQRQVSYFGDREGIKGLLRHIRDGEISCEMLRMLWDGRLEEEIPYIPFSEWPDVTDPVFKDFIQRLTNLDPVKRLTVHQALEHPWLSGL